eukprot:COSAG01_NODE_200_length_22187_cov_59.140529_2_plen_162_part_00
MKVPLEEMKKGGTQGEGGFVMIKGNPCRILDIIAKVKGTGPTANDRVVIKGAHVFKKDVRCEDTFNLTAGFDGMEVPVASKASYSLIDIDTESGFLTLLTEEGETKEDTCLSRASDDPEETDFDEVGSDIIQRFDEGENLRVTVLTIMGKDLVTQVTRDLD